MKLHIRLQAKRFHISKKQISPTSSAPFLDSCIKFNLIVLKKILHLPFVANISHRGVLIFVSSRVEFCPKGNWQRCEGHGSGDFIPVDTLPLPQFVSINTGTGVSNFNVIRALEAEQSPVSALLMTSMVQQERKNWQN